MNNTHVKEWRLSKDVVLPKQPVLLQLAQSAAAAISGLLLILENKRK
jgi:hypothetical protein